jgi:hypothetical protein
VEAHLLLDAEDLPTRHGRLDEEGADALVATGRIDAGEDDREPGVRRVRDEVLGAVQHVAVALATGRGGQPAGVGADARLREREAAEPFAAGELGKKATALLFGSLVQDRPADERRVRRVAGARGAARGRHLLERERIRHVVEARTTVLLRNEDAERAELAEPRHDVAREPAGPIVLRRDRGDALRREGPHRVAELALGVGQLDLHALTPPLRSAHPSRT